MKVSPGYKLENFGAYNQDACFWQIAQRALAPDFAAEDPEVLALAGIKRRKRSSAEAMDSPPSGSFEPACILVSHLHSGRYLDCV